jgi:hypothetical protein
MSYQEKYLKYKNKYLALKNQQTAGASGGINPAPQSRIGSMVVNRFNPEEIIGKIIAEPNDSYAVWDTDGTKILRKSDEGVTYLIIAKINPVVTTIENKIRVVVDETIPEITESNQAAAIKMLESITCPICLTRQKKVLICENGHQLCAHCTIDLVFNRQIRSCPQCRASIELDKLKVLHQKYLFRTTF